MPQKSEYLGVLNVQIRHADDGIGFIDAAISSYSEMELRQPRSVPQRGFAFIARTRIDLVEFHRRFRSCRRLNSHYVVCMKIRDFPILFKLKTETYICPPASKDLNQYANVLALDENPA